MFVLFLNEKITTQMLHQPLYNNYSRLENFLQDLAIANTAEIPLVN